MDTNYINDLLAKRANVVEQQRERTEAITREGRLPSAEETEVLERFDAEYDRLTETIESWTRRAQREQEADQARAVVDALVRPDVQAERNQAVESEIDKWLRGAVAGEPVAKHFEVDLKPAANFLRRIRNGMDATEARAIYTDGGSSGGSLVVPVGFYTQLYQYVEESSAMLRISRVLTSDGGGAWTFPKVTTHGIGTQVSGQGTALAGTDPVLGTMRLDAYRYGQLVKVSTTAARDSGFPLLDFIAENIGRAVGRVIDTALVTGSGSGAPNGIVTAASVGAYTGGSLIALGGGVATAFTNSVDPLITLQHSVAEEYAQDGAFVMNRYTAGTVRKLRDGNSGTLGSYIWTPTTTFEGVRSNGAAGELLGSPVFTDVNFGTQGSAVKTVAFGDFSAYYVRQVGNFRFERSDERYFDTDEIGFRGVMEVDADLIDTGAVKLLQQLVSP